MRRDDVEQDAAILVARGDVEEAELVGAGRVIGLGGLDRIAGIDEIDEVDALDDAAVLDVEAGDDAGLQGHATDLGSRRARQPSSNRRERWRGAIGAGFGDLVQRQGQFLRRLQSRLSIAARARLVQTQRQAGVVDQQILDPFALRSRSPTPALAGALRRAE